MSQNRPQISPGAPSHSGRRRHAAPTRPNWTRRAGLVGGVVSAIALGGAGAPALADNHGRPDAAKPTALDASPLSTAVTARQASDAVAQNALAHTLAAAREHAATTAAAAASAKHKAAVAAKAAKARATATALAASRSAKRAKLTATPAASSSSSSSSSSASSASSSASAAAPSASKVDKLIAFLKAQIGKPYVYGATGPSSYDCSGLTQTAYATVGISLPRTSQEQSTVGTPVSLNSLRAGDLVFWGGEGSAYHVGVYIGDGQYLDAANPSSPVGIKPLTYSEPDWAVRVL